ncbi:MAG: helix-turn-helix domain-containing protein [Clostridiales bacterium]|nr:MAG: helix-turn-helix domain-containing protein [Clostridiales bacterium]
MNIDYAKMILALRVKMNISQQQLGELLGVSFSTVNRWEKKGITNQPYLQKRD